MDSTIFEWVILPLLIFLSRVVDVAMGTVRIIFLSKNIKMTAAILGFFEILIWLLAIRQVFLNLTNPVCYLAFAGGFACGNYVGMCIEEKLAIGFEVVRVITQKGADELIAKLKSFGYGITSMPAQGTQGTVHIIFSIIKRSDTPQFIKTVRALNPKAFYTVESINSVQEGVFPKTGFEKK